MFENRLSGGCAKKEWSASGLFDGYKIYSRPCGKQAEDRKYTAFCVRTTGISGGCTSATFPACLRSGPCTEIPRRNARKNRRGPSRDKAAKSPSTSYRPRSVSAASRRSPVPDSPVRCRRRRRSAAGHSCRVTTFSRSGRCRTAIFPAYPRLILSRVSGFRSGVPGRDSGG